MRSTVFQVLNEGDYEQLDVKGKVVIDVGAYIGDSAIYFALKGARKVIAIEPHPGAFAEMLDNTKLNNMESVIIPINAGLASSRAKHALRTLMLILPMSYITGLVIVLILSRQQHSVN